ncbi:hypothetical protein HDZ31DRAFT_78169 [Schizophyllum fasciatum]
MAKLQKRRPADIEDMQDASPEVPAAKRWKRRGPHANPQEARSSSANQQPDTRNTEPTESAEANRSSAPHGRAEGNTVIRVADSPERVAENDLRNPVPCSPSVAADARQFVNPSEAPRQDMDAPLFARRAIVSSTASPDGAEHHVTFHIGTESSESFVDRYGRTDTHILRAVADFHCTCDQLGDAITALSILVERPVKDLDDAATALIGDAVRFDHLRNCRDICIEYREPAAPIQGEGALRARADDLPRL